MNRISSSLRGLWKKLPYAPEIYWRVAKRGSFDGRPRVQAMDSLLADWVSQILLTNVPVDGSSKKMLPRTLWNG